MIELCKHDWVGDDDCAYCKIEELEARLQATTVLINSVDEFCNNNLTIHEDDRQLLEAYKIYKAAV